MLLQRAIPYLKKQPLALLVPFFLALRLTTLLTSVESVSWEEELYRGTIAKEILEGLKLPLWDYQADHYDGGSLAVGFLAIPFFLLLGPNLFALKLVPLFFSLGTLIVSFLFVKRFFGQKAAWAVGLLLTLSPPVFTGLSLSAIGSHPESVFFSSLMLLFFYRFLYEDRHKIPCLILFGLSSGLGLSFATISLLTLLTLLISWFLLDRRSLFSKQGWIFLGAFGVGLLPWILYNWTHEFLGLRYTGGLLLGDKATFSLGTKLASIPTRLYTLLLRTIPTSFCFRPILQIPGELLSLTYSLLAMLLLIPFLFRKIREALPLALLSFQRGRLPSDIFQETRFFPLLLYPLVFLLSYSATCRPFLPMPPTFAMEDLRLLPPLYYFVFLLMAIVGTTGKAPRIFLCGLLAIGALGQWGILFKETPGRAFRYQGYSYFLLGETWGKNRYSSPQTWRDFEAVAEQFEEPQRRYVYWGLSHYFFKLPNLTSWKSGDDPALALRAIRELSLSYRFYLLEALGHTLTSLKEEDLMRCIALGKTLPPEEQPHFFHGLSVEASAFSSFRLAEEYLKLLRKIHPPYPEIFYFNLGGSFSHCLHQGHSESPIFQALDSLREEERVWIYRGMGENAAVILILSSTLSSKTLAWLFRRLSREEQEAFSWGLGWGLREPLRTIEDRARAMDWLRRLPAGSQAATLQGLRAFEGWYGMAHKE